MESKNRQLRTGYTTGSCAAAAAKAACLLALGREKVAGSITIPLPDGTRHAFRLHSQDYQPQTGRATASVIKDAGDDPDITNGAEIQAEARMIERADDRQAPVILRGGKGVGTVTKPGLAVAVGNPAINPVPQRMIREAAEEALAAYPLPQGYGLEITISVPEGEELATKTLNARLGIMGGISILGTSGIVKPLSAEAWTSSISAAMNVAQATGYSEVVLSTGRVSEKAFMASRELAPEAFVMMGDYVEFSLTEANRHGFRRIHLAAHWAKMLKIAMGIPQTHVRHGAIDLDRAARFLETLSPGLLDLSRTYNTAREIYDLILADRGAGAEELFRQTCRRAREYAEGVASGTPVSCHLVSYEGVIIAQDE